MANSKKTGQTLKMGNVRTRPGEVSSVAWYHRAGHFNSDEEAQGAFKLAHQQGLDGMGESVAGWMGLTDQEYDAWMRNAKRPRKRKPNYNKATL